MVIRAFIDAQDRDGVIALYRTAWHAAYDAIDGAEAIDGLVHSQLTGLDPALFALDAGDVALVAVDGGQIIGGVRGHPRSDAVHLSGFYVMPGRQRSGIGRTLLAELERHYPNENCWRADVRPSSQGALRFYERLGFVAIGTDFADAGLGYPIDMIKMRRGPGRG